MRQSETTIGQFYPMIPETEFEKCLFTQMLKIRFNHTGTDIHLDGLIIPRTGVLSLEPDDFDENGCLRVSVYPLIHEHDENGKRIEKKRAKLKVFLFTENNTEWPLDEIAVAGWSFTRDGRVFACDYREKPHFQESDFS